MENSSYVVSELARFARGRIEDSIFTGSRSTAFQNCLLHCFSIGGIFHRRNFPGGTFLGGIFLGGIYRSRSMDVVSGLAALGKR